MKTEFQALKTNWLAALQGAGDRIAQASAADGDQDAALAALDVVLMKVVLTAGLAFTGNPAMGPILFDQSRLDPAGRAPDEKPAAPTPCPRDKPAPPPPPSAPSGRISASPTPPRNTARHTPDIRTHPE